MFDAAYEAYKKKCKERHKKPKAKVVSLVDPVKRGKKVISIKKVKVPVKTETKVME